MRRRSFIKFCGGAVAAAGLAERLAGVARAEELKTYGRVKLVSPDGEPLKAKLLSGYDAYIFSYPFRSTPCFLMKLQESPAHDVPLATEEQEKYTWRGGVGPDGTIVAFSAICAHQLAYPTKDLSAINYYVTGKSELASKGHIKETSVIVCCAHGSIYDPAQGAKVLSGPATQPLAAIALEYDKDTDELSATGVYGGKVFDNFFKAYKTDLLAAYGPGVARRPMTDTSVAVPMAAYTRLQLRC
jgi:arsenite oxidase small subunit